MIIKSIKKNSSPIMKLQMKSNWLSAGILAQIEPTPTPLARLEEPKESACDIIKVNISQNSASSGSETYTFKMKVFENRKPE